MANLNGIIVMCFTGELYGSSGDLYLDTVEDCCTVTVNVVTQCLIMHQTSAHGLDALSDFFHESHCHQLDNIVISLMLRMTLPFTIYH